MVEYAATSGIARITLMKSSALSAAPIAGNAYEIEGTMRARMLTLERADCALVASGVGVICFPRVVVANLPGRIGFPVI